MKPGLDVLPTENWMDVFVFPWIQREQLVAIVGRFRERKFVEFLQFFLHRCGKHKLMNDLHYDEDGLYKLVDDERHPLDLPVTPLPSNIKSFKNIRIYHVDAQILDFLRQLEPILSNVELNHVDTSPDCKIILAKLLPLLNGIDSLTCFTEALSTMEESLGEQWARLKQITIVHNGRGMKFATDWLTYGTGPKQCNVFIHDDQHCGPQIVKAIRKQFLSAKTPSTFKVLVFPPGAWQFAGFHLENDIGEELNGEQDYIYADGTFKTFVRITRHRTNGATELQEWVDENSGKDHGQIWIIHPTIDLPDEDDTTDGSEDDENNKKDEDNARKPSRSKGYMCLI